MKRINLEELNLKTFTEQDALDYCQLNSINHDSIIGLNLYNNYLTDISGIKLFKNTERLNLWNNELTDISVIHYLNNLEYLDIENLELESDQIEYIKNKKLDILYCPGGFKDMSVLNQLKNVKIHKI